MKHIDLILNEYELSYLYRNIYSNGGGNVTIESIIATITESGILLRLISVKGKFNSPKLEENGMIDNSNIFGNIVLRFFEYD